MILKWEKSICILKPFLILTATCSVGQENITFIIKWEIDLKFSEYHLKLANIFPIVH